MANFVSSKILVFNDILDSKQMFISIEYLQPNFTILEKQTKLCKEKINIFYSNLIILL